MRSGAANIVAVGIMKKRGWGKIVKQQTIQELGHL